MKVSDLQGITHIDLISLYLEKLFLAGGFSKQESREMSRGIITQQSSQLYFNLISLAENKLKQRIINLSE